MRVFSYAVSIVLLGTITFGAAADSKSMIADYHTMLSNYYLVSRLTLKCPNLAQPELEPRPTVDKMLQDKIGIDAYVQTMIDLQKAGLQTNAIKTADKLLTQLSGCEDQRLSQGLMRITQKHAETFSRFKKELPLVKKQQVPIPLRQ
jgi:hypothetical protein